MGVEVGNFDAVVDDGCFCGSSRRFSWHMT
jgi:hypothetical protein